jgi:lipid-binding SYLF domain-containing protein
MKKIIILISIMIFSSTHALAWGWDAGESVSNESQNSEYKTALHTFKQKDPKMKNFFDKAYGYALFPTIGKGGMGIGGAYGSGRVYKRGTWVGNTSVTQLTIGFQFGGQAYSEIIFFKDKKDFDKFIDGNFELGAQASAVAVTSGAAGNVDYSNGVAIFTIAKGGLMYEASVGGQKFSYESIK